MSKFEHGLGTIVDPDCDKPFNEIPTTQCCHCGCHFPLPSFDQNPQAALLRIGRGFCMNCNAFICGERCQECVPQEAMLEIMEGTRNPTAVSVGSIVDTSKLWLPE